MTIYGNGIMAKLPSMRCSVVVIVATLQLAFQRLSFQSHNTAHFHKRATIKLTIRIGLKCVKIVKKSTADKHTKCQIELFSTPDAKVAIIGPLPWFKLPIHMCRLFLSMGRHFY